MPTISSLERVLPLLACPICKGKLQLLQPRPGDGVRCSSCERTYPIADGIPVLIPARAILRPESLGQES